MKVLITGADGFIGRALSQRLAAPGAMLQGRAIKQLTLCDLHAPPLPAAAAPTGARITTLAGSIADATVIDTMTQDAPDVVFHLASVPSGQAEADYERGLSVNLRATLALLDALRRGGHAPTLVFTSSIAVFGTPLPACIDDDTPPHPSLSYGAHKLMAEIVLADASRRGFVQARTVRLPGIVMRPPTPTGALSAFSSELMRALLQHRPYRCPVSPQATLWLLSLPACIDNLAHAAQSPHAALQGRTAWTLPAQRLSIAELVDAFEARRPGTAALVSYAPDPALEAQFGRLPPLSTPRAEAAGFRHDGSVDELLVQAGAPGPA